MSINENQKIELFSEFYSWLKADGIKAKTSERLHRKKIFSALMANNEMTIENFNDFLLDYEKEQIRALKGKTILLDGNHRLIEDIEFKGMEKSFKLITAQIIINSKFEEFEEIKKLIVRETN